MSSLKEVIYKHIKGPYYFGLFGCFRVIIDVSTSYFNATKFCQSGGKRFKNWSQNKQSQKLIEYFENKRDVSNSEPYFYVIKGGDETDKIISGTYVRSELILSIAIWISEEFYEKATNIIVHYYSYQFNERYKNNEKKLNKKLKKIKSKLQEMKMKNKLFKEDIAPKTSLPSKLNMFTLIQKNKDGSEYPYYVIRCQKGLYNKTIKDLKIRYPNMTIVHEIKYNPNSINLFNRIKENVTYIDTKFNHLKVSKSQDSFLEIFIKDIQNLIPKL